MPRKVTSMSDYQGYLSGVLDRSNHHAQAVRHTVIYLTGLIAAYADPGSISYLEREGESKNVIWFSLSDNRYVATYDHETQTIQLRRGSLQGEQLMSINDALLPTASGADLWQQWFANHFPTAAEAVA